MHKDNYKKLSAMLVLSFISMYVLMYAMVNEFSNVLPNFNQFYMAGLMSAPMALIELSLMRTMYQNKVKNITISSLSILAIAVFFLAIRAQSAVGDEQFLKSMIPHHAGAILMCEEANIDDQEIRELCLDIIKSQQGEIDQMKGILLRINR